MSANFGVVRTDPVCREACPFCEPIAEQLHRGRHDEAVRAACAASADG